jgi:putative FmdB family regulatory protein
MPTYEYECEACGHCFERFQSMSDEPVKTCPECKGKVRKLLGGGVAVVVKAGASGDTPSCGPGASCYGGGGCGLAR